MPYRETERFESKPWVSRQNLRHGRFEDVTICLIFGNCVSPQNFHTRKLDKIMVIYAVSSAEIFHIEIRPSGRSSRYDKKKGGPNNTSLLALDKIGF